jgi:hypothetical protein
MARCETCGNDYDKSFEIKTAKGKVHVFDSFECAIHAVAPRCAECGCVVMGHGIESKGIYFCGARCAERFGIEGARDRVEPGMPVHVD